MSKKSAGRKTFYQLQARHVRQCWTEARFVGVVWLVSLVYCGTVIATMGYIPPDSRPDVPSMVWGVPSWVFWGLFFPWVILIIVTWLYAALLLKDDEPFMDFPQGDDDAAGSD